jgi:hypothetical protein
MNPSGTILNATPSSFAPIVQQSLAPVLLFAYEEPGCQALRREFDRVAGASPRSVLLVRANLTQYPELTRSLGCPPSTSLTLYWEGAVQFQFLGNFTARELKEILVKAATISSPESELGRSQ